MKHHHSEQFNAWVRALLALGILALFSVVLITVVDGQGKGEGPVANVLLGALAAALANILSYYYGQAVKEEARGTAANPMVTEVANTPNAPVPVTTEAVDAGYTVDSGAPRFTEPDTTLPRTTGDG